MKTSQCNKCKEVKALTEFHKRTKNKTGFSYRCKACVALVVQIRNPEIKLALGRPRPTFQDVLKELGYSSLREFEVAQIYAESTFIHQE